MRQFDDLTIDQEMKIFDILESEGYAPVESARYITHIRSVARKCRFSVKHVWDLQRQFAMAETVDFIARVSKNDNRKAIRTSK